MKPEFLVTVVALICWMLLGPPYPAVEERPVSLPAVVYSSDLQQVPGLGVSEISLNCSGAKLFLESQQNGDGSWSGGYADAIGGIVGETALVAFTLMDHGCSPKSTVIEEALEFVNKYCQSDGGIYNNSGYAMWDHDVYTTAAAIVAFTKAMELDSSLRLTYAPIVKRARTYLLNAQVLSTNSDGSRSPKDGGWFRISRNHPEANSWASFYPDIYSTYFAIKALLSTEDGLPDQVRQRAVAFVKRCYLGAGMGFSQTPQSVTKTDNEATSCAAAMATAIFVLT